MTVATRPEVIEQVKYEWAYSPDISARQLAKIFQDKYGNSLVRDRRITEIVAEAKAQAPEKPFPLTPWEPWVHEDSPDQTLFILKLDHFDRQEGGAGLLAHEAAWARRLWKPLQGLDQVLENLGLDGEELDIAEGGAPQLQLELVRTYGKREQAAYYLQAPPYTRDLDGFVAFQMWMSPEHQRKYEAAIAAGVVPIPFIGVTEPFLRELLAQGSDTVGDDAWVHLRKGLLAQGPGMVSEKVWDRLSWHPIFRRLKQLSEGAPPDGWSNVFLQWLNDPQDYQQVMESTAQEAKPVPRA
jgi:hypothetical protein